MPGAMGVAVQCILSIAKGRARLAMRSASACVL